MYNVQICIYFFIFELDIWMNLCIYQSISSYEVMVVP